ncbi:MAG TPA: PHP domain-containing protein [Candidatus Nanoarchaeia archaeon]|nr:PHP domain-containing protein [Candidatus Nanoarchaeia archaeon]
MIDLQSHTTASDGELSPEELIELAIKKKLSAIAITDHDSVGSLRKAIEYSKGKNIEIIPGVELSCDDPLFSYEKIDVLGLFIDYKNKELLNLIKHINFKREENKKLIIGKLRYLGYKITYSDVKKTVGGTFGRPHIAKYLIKKYPDKFSSVRDVFDKLIGRGKKAFVKTESRVSVADAIRIIKQAKGLAILAHPGIYPREHSLKLVDHFIASGGDGIETYYPYHIVCPELKIDRDGNEQLNKFYKKIVKSKNLLESGGNDHHDMYRSTLGEIQIPENILENLKKAVKTRNKSAGK